MDPDLPVDLVRLLSALLDDVSSGDLTASTATRQRIEGAIVALQALSGEDPASIVDRLVTEDEP